MMRWIIFAGIVFMFSSCISQQAAVKKDDTFTINNETVQLKTYLKQRNFDGCAVNAYVIKDNDIFIEYVKLKPRCTWNGLGSSLFRNLLNQEFDLKVIFSKKLANYSVVKYKNDTKEFYFISTYIHGGNYFIIDYSGEFAHQISKKFDFIVRAKQMTQRFSKSLVKMNLLQNYFSIDDHDDFILLKKK